MNRVLVDVDWLDDSCDAMRDPKDRFGASDVQTSDAKTRRKSSTGRKAIINHHSHHALYTK